MRSVPVPRRIAALLTLVVLALCGVALPASTASADDTVGMAISPANAKGAGLLEGRKFSNGTINVKGTDMGMTVTVSPTQTAMKGSAFGMRVGIARGSDGHRER